MESNKLGKKIRDWTINLGFRLPDGSAPPPDFFAFLTVTPHRRQLWETLMETIQPRQKVEIMRKQILVAKLQERKKRLTKSDLKQAADRIDLWFKQKALELDVIEKRKANIKLERSVMEKASSLIFEIYNLRELENQIKELGEKSMLLKLLSKRGNRIVEDFDRDMVKLRESWGTSDVEETSLVGGGRMVYRKSHVLKSSSRCSNQENCPEKCINKTYLLIILTSKMSESVRNELLSMEKCKCSRDGTHKCELLNKINKFCDDGIREQQLWVEVVRKKKDLLSDFSAFVEELNSTGMNNLSEKREKMEAVLNRAIAQLKQKIMEKSVQAMVNSIEGKQLDLEIEKLEERFLEGINSDELRNESLELISYRTNISSEDCELAWKNIKNYLTLMGLKSYQEYLKEKTKMAEEAVNDRKKKDKSESKEGEERLERSFTEFESIVHDINFLQAKDKKVEEQIINRQENFESRLRSGEEETEARIRERALDGILDKLKLSAEQQVDLLLETPLGAFRMVKNSSGRNTFEFESVSDCVNNYGWELKHFFSNMLIPPTNNLQKILSEIERRKRISNDITAFTAEREKLAAVQRRIRDQLTSVRYDSQTCEKNFRDSDRILRGVSYKAEELILELDLVEKILKDWVEQPYRLMVRGTLEGRSLREYEEKCRKAKKF